ncbi:MAG: adenine deaminase C-terminal domain-containing protein, partial [Candidatus Bipolaricaulia bacterium]
ARNLDELLPLLRERTAPFVHFCTDDRHAETILREGHIDGMIRRALAAGTPAEIAVAAATIHAARAYGLQGIGAIAPGYEADLLVLSDLKTFAIRDVYAGGVRWDGDDRSTSGASSAPQNTLRIKIPESPFRIPAAPRGVVRALVAHPEGLVTDEERVSPRVIDGDVVADPARDLLKLAVVERHRGTGRVGVGLVRGFGLSSGALASTVAHDSHNLIVVGTDDAAMETAVRRLSELGGGQVVVDGGRVLAELALPVAGLMSPRSIQDVAAAQTELEAAAHVLGCRLPSPFMTLSFLALPVIPHLKLTDRGWVDVDRFEIVPFYVDDAARSSRTT